MFFESSPAYEDDIEKNCAESIGQRVPTNADEETIPYTNRLEERLHVGSSLCCKCALVVIILELILLICLLPIFSDILHQE